MKTLILTGWGGLDYATAAMVTYIKFPKADVMGMSKRRLPEFLSSLLYNKQNYQRIIILGIGLNGNPEELLKLFKNLHQQKINVNWISVFHLPKWLPVEINNYLEVKVGTGKGYLTEYVAELYDQNCDNLLELHSSDTKNDLHYLLEAAQYRYRNLQDVNSFSDAIKTISKGDSLNKKQLDQIEYYKKYSTRELKGNSPAITELWRLINLVAPKDEARVIIYGETGTGKETVALHIHEKSQRNNQPFIVVNCASTSTNLMESHLFGHKKGAFTGAYDDREGAFEEADGGTLFLDEVGELTLEVQASLLRVLQEGRFHPIGSVTEIDVDVRVIAATNRNLAQMVKEGKFREDLFYRLNVIPITSPPLRDHMEDIKEIADNFWYRLHNHKLSNRQIVVLKQYHWPGNVRELNNFLNRASVLEEEDFQKLLAQHRESLSALLDPLEKEPENLEEVKYLHVQKILKRYNNNITHAAKALGITRTTLRTILDKNLS